MDTITYDELLIETKSMMPQVRKELHMVVSHCSIRLDPVKRGNISSHKAFRKQEKNPVTISSTKTYSKTHTKESFHASSLFTQDYQT